jgi:cyclopropane fatty-acyl-phospholipid synthase-like methyltransferase
LTDKNKLIFNKLLVDTENEKLIEKMFAGVDFNNKSILEIGCGLGDNLKYCSKFSPSYICGLDISSERLKITEKKLENINYELRLEKLENYKFTQKFDVILAIGVFEYIEDPFFHLIRILTKLNKNGKICILISKPIFLKKISFLFRVFFNKFDIKIMERIVDFIYKKIFLFENILKKILYFGEKYSLKQTIWESLMVSRYNLMNIKKISNILKNNGFEFQLNQDILSSMVLITATKK